MPWKDVPIPHNMADMEIDRRGYPVPYVVMREGGKPHFVVNDVRKVFNAAHKRLCAICGKRLGDVVWFAGGPGSALLNHTNEGVYADGPMHHECMRYAMQVCPYLAHRTEVYISDAVAENLTGRGVATMAFNGTLPGTPELFVCVAGRSYVFDGSTFRVEYRRVEYWRDGALIDREQGKREAQEAAERLRERLAE